MFAQPFRIATWQVTRLPAVQAGGTNSLADERRFAEIATTLGETDADVIILYGIPESEAVKKVTGLIKPRKYSVAHHMVFRHAGSKSPLIGQAVAIMSRREKLAAKTIEWNNTGRIDMPGGFGFTVFRFGPHAVSIYVAGLPGSLTNGVGSVDGHYFSRKRNYAAQFLAHHASWVAGTYTNPVHATYLTGDFLLNPKGPVADECGKILDAAGFRTSVPGMAVDKSAVSVTNALELDRVQDPIFTRGVEFIASRQLNRAAPDFPIMVCDLTLKAAGTTAKATVPATRPPALKPVPVLEPGPPAPLPIPAPEPVARALPALTGSFSERTAVQQTPPIEPDSTAPPAGVKAPKQAAVARLLGSPEQRWVWWLAAGAFGVGLLAARVRRRRRSAERTVSRRANQAVYLEIRASANGSIGSGETEEAAVLREASTTTGHAEEARWRKAEADATAESMRARMMPQLKSLMRDQVVSWLARQRGTLLESHERGTQQVLELQQQLERIKQQFQQRMVTQQQRISELDSALRNKEKIILDLLRNRPPQAPG